MADNRGRDSHNMWTEMPPSRKNKLHQPLQPEKTAEEKESSEAPAKGKAKKTAKKQLHPVKTEKKTRAEKAKKDTPNYLEDDGTLAKPMDIQSKALKNKTKNRNEKEISVPKKSLGKRISAHFSRYILFYLIALILFAVASFILSRTLLFNITGFVIKGETVYSDSEIIDKSGVELGTNLNSVDAGQVEHTLIDGLPFVDKVTVSKDFFGSRLVITLNQATPMANIETNDGGYYLVSENGRILDSTLTSPNPEYVTVTGFHPEYAVSGAFLSVADEGTRNYLTKFLKSVKVYGNLYVETDIGASRKIDILYDVIEAYTTVGIEDKIKSIDIKSIYSIRLDYDNRFIFDLGDDTDMKVKLTIAKNLISEEEFANESGELDLSKAADPELGMKVTFRPTFNPGDIPPDDDNISEPDDTSEPDDIQPGDTTPPEE